MRIRVTNYLEVISSWCYWAAPMWALLQERYAGRVDFEWKVALMDASGFPKSRAQAEWFYHRSGLMMRAPFALQPGWFQPEIQECLAPNLVAEAAREFGVNDDRAWLALAHATIRENVQTGELATAVEIVAKALRLDAKRLGERASSPEIEARVRATTAEFHAMQVTQRPTFVVQSDIGDRAVFSGFARIEPIAAAIDAMLDDIAFYKSYEAQFGGPPPA